MKELAGFSTHTYACVCESEAGKIQKSTFLLAQSNNKKKKIVLIKMDKIY